MKKKSKKKTAKVKVRTLTKPVKGSAYIVSNKCFGNYFIDCQHDCFIVKRHSFLLNRKSGRKEPKVKRFGFYGDILSALIAIHKYRISDGGSDIDINLKKVIDEFRNIINSETNEPRRSIK